MRSNELPVHSLDGLPVVQIRRSHALQFPEALQEISKKRMGKLRKGPLSELTRWRRGTILKSRKFRLRAVQSLDNRASLLSEPGHAWGDVTRNLLNFLADGACGGAAATARAGQSSP
jgi:hypothetical protein